MKLKLANGTTFRDADVRRAVLAALKAAGWSPSKPVYVGCWHGRMAYQSSLDAGLAAWVRKRAELWQLAEMVRYAACRRLGLSHAAAARAGALVPISKESPTAALAPRWALEAGLVPLFPHPRRRARPAALEAKARAKARKLRAAVARQLVGAKALRELSAGLEKLEDR